MNRGQFRLAAAALLLLVAKPVHADPPSSEAATISTADEILRQRIRTAIELTQRRYLTAGVHTPWQIVHGVKPYGRELLLRQKEGDKMVNAVDYLLTAAAVNGERIWQPTDRGYLEPISNSQMEGHPDQFLSALAQSGVPLLQPIPIKGQPYVVWHLVAQAKYDYYNGAEASWTLIALATYDSVDSNWVNRYGQKIHLDELVTSEVAAQVTTRACYGTHNLYALAYALNRFRATGQPLRPAYQQAADKIARYVNLAKQLQNEDGTFSTNGFEGRGWSGDSVTQIDSTGHQVEWLSLALSDEELRSPWMTRAVESLVGAFERVATVPVECGPLYHGARGLRQYSLRRFSDTTATAAAVNRPPAAKPADATPAKLPLLSAKTQPTVETPPSGRAGEAADLR